ncbi:hypothetical protein DFO70_103429 [Cytobacillus firmus]|uniref:Uncharacterized protein n=2 Tax=Cytobacillus TaxID=2675230 RepID=A0A366K294_CYTFI|nr:MULTISPECIES: hypothetical protein [Cytobacillus]RBP95387.1 hypothetical protein DFO70_103429 [Cytobacillus firmus]TDX44228.1 hypothetical protein DFO72_104442 [Cytobacillus oceanisediminis]
MTHRQKNILERNLTGEGHFNNLPRDEKGRFVSQNKLPKKLKKQEGYDDFPPRSIKLKKVKGTYGTYMVKDKLIPDNLKSLIYICVTIGSLIVLF